MSPRRIKTMASSEGRKEQPENSDTPEDQARVTRQKQPSVDSTQRPQVPPQNISLEDRSAGGRLHFYSSPDLLSHATGCH